MSSDEDFDFDEEVEGSAESDGDGSSRSVENSDDNFIASEYDGIDDGNENYEPESEDDEEEENTEYRAVQRRRTRAHTRQCATKTNKRMSQVIHGEEMTEKQALKGMVQDGDLEYLHDTASENNDDESISNKSPPKMSRRKSHKRRRPDSGDEDESTDESVGEGATETKRKKASVRNLSDEFNKEPSEHRGRDTVKSTTYFQSKFVHSPSRRKCSSCPSTKDAKTNLDLPRNKEHVCFIMPDETRYCYTLETLYRVAIQDAGETSDGIKLLQPPYFDYPMEDDLKDQIVGRFGRNALDIRESKVFRSIADSPDESMGPDVYCCPLCYSEAYRRTGNLLGDLAKDDEGETEKAVSGDPFYFDDAPMTILTNIGLETAATFCFRLLASVKRHVETAHDVDPSEMKGNTLFSRFQIRTGDGLLQHWLKANGRGYKFPYNPWKYWAIDGNREAYLTLSNQVGKARDKEDRTGEQEISSFSSSFPNRSKNLWNKLSDPYLKPLKDDLKDMIDNNEVEEDTNPMTMFDQEPDEDLEDRFVEHLRKKNQELGNTDPLGENKSLDSDSSASDDYSFPSEDWETDPLVLNDISGIDIPSPNSEDVEEDAASVESEEESVDPWTETKMQKPTAALRRKKIDDSDDEEALAEMSSPSKKCHHQRKIVDSDDELDLPNIVSPNKSPHKRIIDVDEEDA